MPHPRWSGLRDGGLLAATPRAPRPRGPWRPDPASVSHAGAQAGQEGPCVQVPACRWLPGPVPRLSRRGPGDRRAVSVALGRKLPPFHGRGGHPTDDRHVLGKHVSPSPSKARPGPAYAEHPAVPPGCPRSAAASSCAPSWVTPVPCRVTAPTSAGGRRTLPPSDLSGCPRRPHVWSPDCTAS